MEEPTPSYRKVLLAREKGRDGITVYIRQLFNGFTELHGDRLYREDPSILGGFAFLGEQPVLVIGHRKGRSTEEQIRYNFGMTSPEGYRKAIRLMKLAEKLSVPVITFVDTPGAYPGIEAETNGQSNAIAGCIACMSQLEVPTIAVITGEGGSGGALALASADKVFMLENAVYSILSPEGFASILWKDAKRASQASELMKLTAEDLQNLGLIDGVILETEEKFTLLSNLLERELAGLKKLERQTLLNARYQKYRKFDEKKTEGETF